MSYPKYAKGYPKSNNLNPNSLCPHSPKTMTRLHQRKGTTSQHQVKKTSVTLTDGPYDGKVILLTVGTPNTLPFRVGSFKGRYNQQGVWTDM